MNYCIKWSKFVIISFLNFRTGRFVMNFMFTLVIVCFFLFTEYSIFRAFSIISKEKKCAHTQLKSTHNISQGGLKLHHLIFPQIFLITWAITSHSLMNKNWKFLIIFLFYFFAIFKYGRGSEFCFHFGKTAPTLVTIPKFFDIRNRKENLFMSNVQTNRCFFSLKSCFYTLWL